MFFCDDLPVIAQSSLSLWTIAFFVNLGLFVLFASAKAVTHEREVVG